MLFYEQRDKDEVCRTLGVDRGYLRVLIHRAKSKLRDALQKNTETARRSWKAHETIKARSSQSDGGQMNHRESLDSQAAERYLLGEMSEIERHQFEDHYFSCTECAEDVKLGSTLATGVREVFANQRTAPAREPLPRPGWFDWLRGPALVSASFAALMACVVGYQSLVLIPGMRQGLSARAIEPVGLRSVSRGSEPVVAVGEGAGFFAVAPDIDAAPDTEVSWVLQSESGVQVESSSAKAPAPGRPLILLLRNESVKKGARYVIHLTQQSRNLGDFPFLAGSK
jgi:hypothetical protein